MKIGQPSDNPISTSMPSAKGGKSTSAAAGAASTTGATPAGVEVTVSKMARTLESAKNGDTADVDMAKVNAVRAAIQNGTYKVNAEAIADKLLSNAQDMLKGAST
jgi:negative regulator of flagellin synthesis FlgM